MAGVALLIIGVELFFCLMSLLVVATDRSDVLTAVRDNQGGVFDESPGGRALNLMRSVLDEQEYAQVMTCGYLDIHSRSVMDRIYRVKRFGGLVSVYEHGVSTRELCVQPAVPLPTGDVVAIHKLLIEADEERYLATAKVYPSLTPGARYRP